MRRNINYACPAHAQFCREKRLKTLRTGEAILPICISI